MAEWNEADCISWRGMLLGVHPAANRLGLKFFAVSTPRTNMILLAYSPCEL